MPALPIHPLTRLQAIGIGKRGPIWPVLGGAPDEGEGGGDGGEGDGGKTFTQAELERIVGQRVGEERAKYTDYDQLKADSTELAAIKDKDKTDDQRFADLQQQLNAEKAARAAAESKATQSELTQLRADRAAEKEGFPRSLAKRLTGTTADEIDAEIAEIMTDLNIVDKRPDGSGGSGRGGGNQARPSTMAAGTELYEKLHPTKK